MEFSDYLRVMRRSWIVVVGFALLGLLGGGLISILVKPTYTADTQLFVAIQSSGSVLEMQQGNSFSQARVQSYVKTAVTPAVLQPVIETLGLNISASQLASQIKATADLNTVLITISVSDSSPVQASAIAQGTALSLVKVVDDLEKPKSGGSSPVSLSIVAPAVAPSEPSSPNVRLDLLLGLAIGLAMGVAGAVLRSSVDSRVRGEADLRELTDAPLLGGISYDPDAVKKPLLTQAPPQSPRAESFRQLRTNMQFANISNHAKTVLVSSSLPGEGKSTTAVNLAIALSQAGQTVCLIDADLRRPSVSEYLGLDRNAGLTTALVGLADVNELLQPWGDDSLFVLSSGQIPPNPSELLGSEEMKQLIEGLEEAFDAVVIDAPPLLPVTDAAVLSQFVGGVVVVVGSQKLRRQDLAKSLNALKLVKANLLGVVLNRLPIKGPDAYTYSYYSHDDKSSSVMGPSRPTPAVKANARRGADQYNGEFSRVLQDDSNRQEVLYPVKRHPQVEEEYRT